MSITFEIVKFKKPTKDDLSKIHMFNPYGYIPILDDDGDSTGWNIYMFRADDKGIQNIINSCYAVKMELTECITDYDIFLKIYVLYKGLSDNWVLFYKKLNCHSIEMKCYVGWHGSWEHINIFRGVEDDNEKIRKMENNF